MRAARRMRWRRRCSVASALSSPIRDAPARHQRPLASLRSATRRTTRRMAKPDTRVTSTAPTSEREDDDGGGHPSEYGGLADERCGR